MLGYPAVPQIKEGSTTKKFHPNNQAENAKSGKNQSIVIPRLSAPIRADSQSGKAEQRHEPGFPLPLSFEQEKEQRRPDHPTEVGIVGKTPFQAVPNQFPPRAFHFLGVEEDVFVEVYPEQVVDCAVYCMGQ